MHRPFFAETLNGLEPDSAPIMRSWIKAGSPQARSRELSRSSDGTAVTVLWDCTAGVFDWHFGIEETVYILEGSVLVTEGGHTRRLFAGDTAFFDKGSVSTWQVDDYVRKVAFCRHPVPPALGFALRVWNRVLRLIPGRAAALPASGGNAMGVAGKA